MKHTLGKQERLKSKKLIEQLYLKGNSVKAFPLRMVYLQTQHTSTFPCQVGVSVSKRNFKLAVDRNKIKRQLRESYRLQKQSVYSNLERPYIFMISYLGKTEPDYATLTKQMTKLLTLFTDQVVKST